MKMLGDKGSPRCIPLAGKNSSVKEGFKTLDKGLGDQFIHSIAEANGSQVNGDPEQVETNKDPKTKPNQNGRVFV